MAKESDDDFCLPKPPPSLLAAPKRPEKKGGVQSLPIIPVQSSSMFTESCQLSSGASSHSDKSEASDTCAICSKNISHLDKLRKSAHVNKCLDSQESSHMFAKAKEKWNNVIDCPMCGEPQPPGPHQAAHAKRCGKAYNIAPKELLKLMKTQRRVRDIKKQHNMVHTKAPLPVKKKVAPVKLKGAPNSLHEENLQLAKALSASVDAKPTEDDFNSSSQFTRVFDPNEKKRKRPRSYTVVEFAPRTCKCEIIQKIQDRFLEAFRVRKTNGTISSHAEMCKHLASRTSDLMQQQTRLLEKLERLERLSQDMYRLIGDESLTDFRIQCLDGSVNAHRCLLNARTSIMIKSCQSVEINESQQIVIYWLQYVYSGRVEWQKDDTEKIQKIAAQYGPDGLLALCTRMLTLSNLEATTVPLASAAESLSATSCDVKDVLPLPTESFIQPPTMSHSSTGLNSSSKIAIPNELNVELKSSSSVDKSEITVDYEDPLQGILLADTSEEREVDDECIVIDTSTDHGRCNAEESPVLKFSDTRADFIDLTSPENVVASRSNSDDMEITLFDMPEESYHSEDKAVSNSPDIFEENDKDTPKNVASEPALIMTPLRRSLSLCRDKSSSRLSLSNRLSSSSVQPPAVMLNDVVQEVNKSSETSFKQPLTIHSVDEKMDAYSAEKICFDEIPEQAEKSASLDPYENECFNYHDPFMEEWYETVDEMASQQVNNEPMFQQSVEDRSQECEAQATKPSAEISRPVTFLSLDPVRIEDRDNLEQLPATSTSQDSFFDTPKFFNNEKRDDANTSSFTGNNHSADLVPPVAHSTPLQPLKKKPRFGSNVKILKTTNITPMPSYESMNDECLKRELAKFGLKPMGRKRAIAILKKIYVETHPEIDPSTPTLRPLVVEHVDDDTDIAVKSKCTKSRARGQAIRTLSKALKMADLPSSPQRNVQAEMANNEDEDFVDLGDKTLNDPVDEPPEESMIDDVGMLPKDFEGMTLAFLTWLRSPENDELHNHLLSLQPVLLDELHLRMSRADSAVCCIPKKALANILDHLGVTFFLPQGSGGRRRAGPRRTVARK